MTSDDIASARKLAERLQRIAAKHEGVSTLTREVTDAYAALAAEVERLTEILGIVGLVIGGHDGACCPCVEVLERAWDAGGRPTSRFGIGGAAAERGRAEALWQLLDDIDTTSDVVKFDDVAFPEEGLGDRSAAR